MDDIISSYILAFDEINALTAYSFTNSSDSEQVKDDMLSFLINGYTLGITHASGMLHYNIEVDIEDMMEAIYVLIDGKDFEDRAEQHIRAGDISALQTLAESEYHRVYNNALNDAAETFSRETNKSVSKTWITVNDNRVRDTHRHLEGMTIPQEDEFYTFDGDHALYPGGFTKAENNVNCRCIVSLTVNEM